MKAKRAKTKTKSVKKRAKTKEIKIMDPSRTHRILHEDGAILTCRDLELIGQEMDAIETRMDNGQSGALSTDLARLEFLKMILETSVKRARREEKKIRRARFKLIIGGAA